MVSWVKSNSTNQFRRRNSQELAHDAAFPTQQQQQPSFDVKSDTIEDNNLHKHPAQGIQRSGHSPPMPPHGVCNGDGQDHIVGAMDDDGGVKKRKKSFTKSSQVDHTYYDYSTRELSELLPPESTRNANSKQKGRVTFPMKLHAIISNPKYRHIICWMPHGRCWKILNKELLASVVCRENFNHENFDSFNRSVNGWGFIRLQKMGPDHKAYYHELFLRGRPELAQAMTRLINPGKRLPDPEGEPNFYDIARKFPLPEDPHDDTHETNTEVHEQRTLIQRTSAVHDSSRSAGARAPPEENPAPYLNRPDKRQRRERHSFPPDRSNHGGSGFAPGYGYAPPFGYDCYAQSHYPSHPNMMYPPYPPPYNYYPGLYGDQLGHHHNPYISPESHVPHHGYYSQQQWNQQPRHYPYELQNIDAEREQHDARAVYEQHIDQASSPNVEATRESNQHYRSPGWSDHAGNVQMKSPYPYNTQSHPPIIHRGSASVATAGTERDYEPQMKGQRYVFPSYGTSSRQGSMYAASADNPTSINFMNESSNNSTDIERVSEYPAELDERKPAAKRPAASTELSMTPVRDPQLHLEWTESFSKDVCNYLLEDDENRKSEKPKNEGEQD